MTTIERLQRVDDKLRVAQQHDAAMIDAIAPVRIDAQQVRRDHATSNYVDRSERLDARVGLAMQCARLLDLANSRRTTIYARRAIRDAIRALIAWLSHQPGAGPSTPLIDYSTKTETEGETE